MEGWKVISSVGTVDLPEKLKLDPETGVISGIPEEFGEFKVMVQLTNACGVTTKLITIIVCAEPQITSVNEINNFVMGQPISDSPDINKFQLTQDGTPGTWKVIVGDLPNGVTLDPETGLISGTPLEYGEFPIEVELTNDCGTDTQEISFVVCALPQITSENEINNFVMGQPISDGINQFQLTHDGTPGTWKVVVGYGELPNGVTLDPETGLISGTPLEHGDFSIKVEVTNDCGTDDQEISIFVCGLPEITGDDTFNFKMGDPAYAQLQFTGTAPIVDEEDPEEPEEEPEE